MNWQNVTVQQFQELDDLRQESATLDPAFVVMRMVEIFYNMSPSEVDSLTVPELNDKAAALSFLSDMPDFPASRHVVVNGRRYRFVYDVRQIHAARNLEVKQYSSGGFINNIHKMAASMVIPQKRNRMGLWRDAKYNAAHHEQYSADLRQAPITAIYGSALFFCNLFKELIPLIADYLVSTLPMEMREEAKRLLVASSQISDGSIAPSQLQTLKTSASTQPTNYHTSKSLTT
jgi:hypothetical protein